jgi:hypothetical protein
MNVVLVLDRPRVVVSDADADDVVSIIMVVTTVTLVLQLAILFVCCVV